MPPAAVEVTALKPHSDSVVCCTFAPDVDLCCSGSNDNSLILWRVTDGWTCRLTGHTGWVTCCNFQPGGALLASGSADETLRLWNLYAVLTGDSSEVAGDMCSVELKEYGGAIQACAFSQSGALLASASADSHVRVWSVETRTITSVLRGHRGWVFCCAFSPTAENLLVTGGGDGQVMVWHTEAAQCLARSKVGTKLGTSREITCCAFHPRGTEFVTGGEDGLIRVWTVEAEMVRTLKGHRGAVRGVAFQPGNGNVLASVEGNVLFGSDNSFRLWDMGASGEPLAVLRGHKRRANACAFSGTGELVVSAGNDNTVRLWRLDATLCIPPPTSNGDTPAPSHCGAEAARTSSQGCEGRRAGSEAGESEAEVGAGVFGLHSDSERASAASTTPRADPPRGETVLPRFKVRDRQPIAEQRPADEGAAGRDEEGPEGCAAREAKGTPSTKPRAEDRVGDPSVLPTDSGGGHVREKSTELHDGGHVPGSVQDEDLPVKGEELLGGGRAGAAGAGAPRASAAGSAVDRSERCGGSGRQWVQIRMPYRVEAKLLELSPGAEEQAEVLGPQTRDGDVMYSITADCGRLQPLPAEPLSTGIDMSPVTQYGVPIRRAPVSSPAKTWSGKLKPT